jgi:putative RNA 2'-phosphotransferase
MTEKQRISGSKFLSLVLRHQPDLIGLNLDKNGWANLNELIEKSAYINKHFTIEMIKEIAEKCPKQRYAIDEYVTKIRANQGHSVAVDMEFQPQQPPVFLYHGTASRYINDIRKTGLQKQNRQYVHLSADQSTAINVGSRHGVPHILTIAAQKMQAAGFEFYKSDNEVWLAKEVPLQFIEFEK